mgnify:CR=1 FL=1
MLTKKALNEKAAENSTKWAVDAEFMDLNTYNKIIERSAASSGKRPAYRIYHGRV